MLAFLLLLVISYSGDLHSILDTPGQDLGKYRLHGHTHKKSIYIMDIIDSTCLLESMITVLFWLVY